jgi:hypothetical protein
MVIMGKAEAELRRRLQELYAIAVDCMSEEEARALFCSIPKRGRGKRGPARNYNPPPSKEAERKRRAREPRIEFVTVRDLTKEEVERLDQRYIDRMNSIGDKK